MKTNINYLKLRSKCSFKSCLYYDVRYISCKFVTFWLVKQVFNKSLKITIVWTCVYPGMLYLAKTIYELNRRMLTLVMMTQAKLNNKKKSKFKIPN